MALFRERPELLPRFRVGERAALEAVYLRYADAVTALVRRATAHDPAWPDLVQECFIQAFSERARMGYDGLREYRPYLLAICRNRVVDWARQRRREMPTGSFDDVPVEEPERDPALVAAVDFYVASLSLDLQQIHEQRYVRCVSQDDAARALRVSRQTVRTREHKLRKGLKNYLRALGRFP